MKNHITLVLLLLGIGSIHSQNQKFEVLKKFGPSVNSRAIAQARTVNELSPDLWSSLILPAFEYNRLMQRRIEEYPQPQNYEYSQEKYKQILDIIGTNISITSVGKTVTAENAGDNLSEEQKTLLKQAANGSEIHVKIKFVYKDQQADRWGDRNRILEGESILAVIPDRQAEFPGGYKEITEYYLRNVIHILDDTKATEKAQQASVKFIVNEQGQIAEAKLIKTSSDPKIDQLILDATKTMPQWNPAMNSKGVKLKQEISLQFTRQGC